ncbi:sugar phosphate isomerase/epimerase family protein [Kallotenue papyrolyticum]|uniref:sugar phosphate isomerase/epimerase family protein n=1 Tax=Kallotenue papyrolyticum TaxID=1325125 RepID=UPI000470566F|nr:sugar phosphate isomerase/epimerase family protein [Kallotenue papyrolyticum]
MQVSMHNWMRAEPVIDTIQRLARYGYDSIEISYDSVELAPGAPGTRAVRDMLREHGLRCYGSISLMFTGRDLIHADPAVRERTVDYLKRCVTMVKELDGQVMSIVPSEVGKIKPMASPEEEWQWAIEGLKEVHDHATKAGVRMAIEPLNRFETNFINRHDQALLLAESVAPDVGVCLDLFHMNIEEADMYRALRAAGDKLYDLHVADNNRMACGHGMLDWQRIFATLREIGYDGSLTVEFVPPIDRTPANPYKNALAAAEKELTPEQLKFIEDHGSGVLSEEFYSWLVEESIKTLRRYL